MMVRCCWDLGQNKAFGTEMREKNSGKGDKRRKDKKGNDLMLERKKQRRPCCSSAKGSLSE